MIISVFSINGVGINLPLHYRMFLHYLGNSGEAVDTSFFTKKEVEAIRSICHQDGDVQGIYYNNHLLRKEVNPIWVVVSTYSWGDGRRLPDWVNQSLGNFSCSSDTTGAYDIYDFRYAKNDRKPVGFSILKDALACEFQNHYIDGIKLDKTTDDFGRCLVTKGYGTPFKVNLNFDKMPAPF